MSSKIRCTKKQQLTQNHCCALPLVSLGWQVFPHCPPSLLFSPSVQWLQNVFAELLSTLQKEATQRGSARCEERLLLLLLHMPSLAPALSRWKTECERETARVCVCVWGGGSSVSAVVAQVSLRTVQRRQREREWRRKRERGEPKVWQPITLAGGRLQSQDLLLHSSQEELWCGLQQTADSQFPLHCITSKGKQFDRL